jgi:hypothetical protein
MPGMGMRPSATLTRAEIVAWRELALAAAKLRRAQRRAEASRRRAARSKKRPGDRRV